MQKNSINAEKFHYCRKLPLMQKNSINSKKFHHECFVIQACSNPSVLVSYRFFHIYRGIAGHTFGNTTLKNINTKSIPYNQNVANSPPFCHIYVTTFCQKLYQQIQRQKHDENVKLIYSSSQHELTKHCLLEIVNLRREKIGMISLPLTGVRFFSRQC
jgi:hypothetical protein